jgi:Cu(I)/Ag(I) efflux system membrane fusion protein
MIHQSFNSNKITLTETHKAITKAGNDTKPEKANDEVYNNLPECCHYTRE